MARAIDLRNATRTREEALTEQFYIWEKRGRGWDLSDYPVVLEPPFRPFLGHYLANQPVADVGRRPGFLGAMVEALRGRRLQEADHDAEIWDEESEEPDKEPFLYGDPLVEMEIGVPPDLKVSRERATHVLSRLANGYDPVAFELIGVNDSVSLQMTCAEPDRAQTCGQIQAYFPEAIVRERSGFLSSTWEAAGDATALVDFGLSREFMMPIRIGKDFEVDPFIPLVAALGEVEAYEFGLFQVLFVSARNPWAESIMRAVTDGSGHGFFADAPELVSLAEKKIAEPLLATVLRIAARAKTEKRAWEIARTVGAALSQFSDPAGNEFMPLVNDGYPDDVHAADVLGRTSCRSGMLLNTHELVPLVHLPCASVRSPKFKRVHKKTKAAPETVIGHRLVLGENHHAGKTITVSVSPTQRVRHTYAIGASGTGKSTLLLNLIAQDVKHGEGIAVFDPHGDLIDEILLRIPEERVEDVILFDPADEEYAIGFNMLNAHSELEKTLLASDLVAVFRRLSTSWGDQMTSVLGNAILAFLESGRGGTLADMRRFLVDSDYRRSFLTTVRDPEIVFYWEREFPLLAGRPQAPILTRLDAFLRPRLIRHMVSQKENRLDFASIMNDGKILLVKLAQGAIGEENSYLLGSLLVSKFHQLALARQAQRESERRDFYLYIDEFHNFITPSLASILSGARKYRIGLILAHQELRQLASRDADVTSAVLSNPCTRICFRVGDADAKKLEDGFSTFDAKDLQNLGVGDAICRVERADFDFNLLTIPLPPPRADAEERRQRIINLSRERYAARRDGIEPDAAKAKESAAAGPSATQAPHGTSSSAPPKADRPSPPLPKSPGSTQADGPDAHDPAGARGGTQHKYLQELIKRWAESRGFRVTIEKSVLDGLGSVDVALEKNGCPSISCEISVTTPAGHEVRNVEKCLAAGFEHIFFVAFDKKVLSQVRATVTTGLSSDQMKRVQFVLPDQVFAGIAALESRGTPQKQAAPEVKELLTAKEVEALLQIDVKTIYSYAQRGMIPYVRIQSNLRFLRSEILAWVAEHRSGAKPRK
jgi:predicted DNA-binding transcriptional regulator AlpA